MQLRQRNPLQVQRFLPRILQKRTANFQLLVNGLAPPIGSQLSQPPHEEQRAGSSGHLSPSIVIHYFGATAASPSGAGHHVVSVAAGALAGSGGVGRREQRRRWGGQEHLGESAASLLRWEIRGPHANTLLQLRTHTLGQVRDPSCDSCRRRRAPRALKLTE